MAIVTSPAGRPEIALVDGYQLHIRPGTLDRAVILEVRREYRGLDVRGLRVLDVGAHIGAFTRWALAQGAAFVAGVEPEPGNAALYAVNTAGEQARCAFYRAACVGDRDPRESIRLYLARRAVRTSCHTTQPTRGRDRWIDVPTVRLGRLLSQHAVEALKLDCEGAEYALLAEPLPAAVRRLAVEFHLTVRDGRERVRESMRRLDADGWRAIRAPRPEAQRLTIGVYER